MCFTFWQNSNFNFLIQVNEKNKFFFAPSLSFADD
jgi:hypothetical protein